MQSNTEMESMKFRAFFHDKYYQTLKLKPNLPWKYVKLFLWNLNSFGVLAFLGIEYVPWKKYYHVPLLSGKREKKKRNWIGVVAIRKNLLPCKMLAIRYPKLQKIEIGYKSDFSSLQWEMARVSILLLHASSFIILLITFLYQVPYVRLRDSTYQRNSAQPPTCRNREAILYACCFGYLFHISISCKLFKRIQKVLHTPFFTSGASGVLWIS